MFGPRSVCKCDFKVYSMNLLYLLKHNVEVDVAVVNYTRARLLLGDLECRSHSRQCWTADGSLPLPLLLLLFTHLSP